MTLHCLHHPNAYATHSDWVERQTLHVAVSYTNPCRWKTRLKLANDFRRHMASCPNVKLYFGEVAFGDRPFEVTCKDYPGDFQFRTRHELWLKENILNNVIERFDPDWKYGAYIDADVFFNRHDFAIETIHQLQHYDWVQMFTSYSDLGPNYEVLRTTDSFAKRFVAGDFTDEFLQECSSGTPYSGGGPRKSVSATGLAWAFRREAFEACGGLLDTCILGSGDWHCAFGLVGVPDKHPQNAEILSCMPEYARSIRIWQNRASRAIKRNVGVVNCHVTHNYHGQKSQRGYGSRWKILRDNHFNPYVDIYRDYQGLYQLTPDKPALRDGIRAYFRSRNEDGA